MNNLLNLLALKAKEIDVVPEHWIRPDHGLSYCFECATKELAKHKESGDVDQSERVDGGWDFAGDSQAFCESCERMLSNSYTEHCCENELSHFEQHGFDRDCPMDCYSMLEIASSLGTTGKNRDRMNAILEKAFPEEVGQ